MAGHVKAYGDRMAKLMANKVHGKSMEKLMRKELMETHIETLMEKLRGKLIMGSSWESLWRKHGDAHVRARGAGMKGVSALVIRSADLNYFQNVKSFESYTE